MEANRLFRSLTWAGALTLLAAPAPAAAPAVGGAKQPVETLVRQWEKDVRKRLGKDARLKALATRHPLVVLHSRHLYAGGDYKGSAYSFVYETAEAKKHRNDVQVLFHNGGDPKSFDFNMLVGQQNLVVDLGKVDFRKDPDPARISIDHPGVASGGAKAEEGHVYLERVRDDRGNNFYVLFQVVAVDGGSRYMAFLWRRLPGGKVVRPQR